MTITILNTADPTARAGSATLLYGAAKTGKTTLLGTLPEGELLLIDVEGGRSRLTDAGKAHHAVSVKTIGDLKEVLHEVRDGAFRKYRYVAIDSLSELERYVLLDLMTNRKKEFAELREYGDCAGKLREFFLRFRDVREQGRHVLFVALEGEIEMNLADGTTQTLIGPLLGKKIAREVCGLVDAVGRVLISPKTGVRGLTFKSSPNFMAGSRYDALNSFDGAMNLPAAFALMHSEVASISTSAPTDPKAAPASTSTQKPAAQKLAA